VFPLNLYARVRFCYVHFARETAGAARTRSSLHPLFFEGATFSQTSDALRREIAELRPRHSEEQSDEAIQTFFVASGLLRFARNDDEVAVLKPATDGAAADALILLAVFISSH
jgi:hypothetical protein